MRYDFKPGEYTTRIYTLIKEQKFTEAIDILNDQLQGNPKLRAALSLLAYCFFRVQDFVNASDCYEQLTQIAPENEQYKISYAQCLYKCGLFEQAMKIAAQIEDSKLQDQANRLKAAIRYAEDETTACAELVKRLPKDELSTEINKGCILYKEGKFELALEKFKRVKQIFGESPGISYNIAVCYYQLKKYDQSLRHIADVIEKGIKEHPELSVGMQTDGIEVASVGNTLALHDSCLVEAFNLKAAIQFNMKKIQSAREALTDMPPRSEVELDQITLHNMAIMYMEEEPSAGFEKLQYLIQQSTFPLETFANLCFLYVKYSFFSLVADVLAENSQLTLKYLNQYEYEFLEAKIIQQTSPEEGFRRFENMSRKTIEMLRKLMREIQDSRKKQKEEVIQKLLNDYDEYLERFISILMANGSVYWELKNYAVLEKFLRKGSEFCLDSEAWQLNLGHVLFMQENNKYSEAIDLYKAIVRKHYDHLLDVSPIVLANLCVAYVMCNLNEEAEDLIRKIEKEEDRAVLDNPNAKNYHLCIVNLVIGTLYCAKNNYEFGISRVMKSLEPYKKKLSTDTWFYTKRCFLALLENMAKQLVTLKDLFLAEIFQFLSHCEAFGREIKANVESALEIQIHPGKNTISYEARYLKWLLLKTIDY